MNFGALLLALVLEVPPAPHYWILSACDIEDAEVRAEIPKDSGLEVRYAIAGSPTCYSVVATVDGKHVSGYVLGSGLDGVAAFETLRAAAARAAFRSQFVIEVQPDPGAITDPSPKALEKMVSAALGKDSPEPLKAPLKKPLKVTF